MRRDGHRHRVVRHLARLAAPVWLTAALAAGTTAGASPILNGVQQARGASVLLAAGHAAALDAAAPGWTGPNVAGLSVAVNETVRAMAVGAPSGEPYVRPLRPVPFSGAPLPVPEPATLGLLVAGCLTILAVSRRARPLHRAP